MTRSSANPASTTSDSGRRRFLAAIGVCAIAPVTSTWAQGGARARGSLTKERRDKLTPGDVLDELKKGNERFRTGKLVLRDYRDQQRTSAAAFAGERSSKNPAYVDAVARTNVLLGLDNIRRRSPLLAELQKKNTILIAGGMYDLTTGLVQFLAEG